MMMLLKNVWEINKCDRLVRWPTEPFQALLTSAMLKKRAKISSVDKQISGASQPFSRASSVMLSCLHQATERPQQQHVCEMLRPSLVWCMTTYRLAAQNVFWTLKWMRYENFIWVQLLVQSLISWSSDMHFNDQEDRYEPWIIKVVVGVVVVSR